MIPQLKEDVPQFARHVHATIPLPFRCAEATAIPPALDKDVSILVMLALAELKISPLETEDFALAEAGAYRNHEQRMVLGTKSTNSSEELVDLLRFHCHRLVFRLLRLYEPSQLRRWVRDENPIFNSGTQYHPQSGDG
ncbi:MAG: hypothetical protein ABSF71_34870 [Terriglobia bacterium]